MAIHLNILTELNERKLRRDAEELRRNYQNAGDDAGRLYGKGLQRGFKDVETEQRRHLAAVAKANADATKAIDRATQESAKIRAKAAADASKAFKDNAKAITDSAEAELRANEKLVKSQERVANAGRARMTVDEQRIKSQQAVAKQTAITQAVEEARSRGLGDSQALTVQLADEEDKLTKLREKDVLVSRRQQGVYATLRAARRDMKADTIALADAEYAHAVAVQDGGTIQLRAQKMVADGDVRAQQTIARAHQDSQSAIARAHVDGANAVGRAHRDLDQNLMNTAQSMKAEESRLSSMWNAFNDLGKQTRWFAESLRIAISPIGIMIGSDFAKAAVTASQSIAFLPAIVTAAGAGMLSLKLATQGFADAIGDMGDPEKWAEGLAKLAPNAQQAALSIKALVDGPIKDMQQAVQDTFFKGLPAQMEKLGQIFGPTITGLTTSIAEAFNGAINGVGNQLSSPQGQFDISNIARNIADAFTNALPAVNSLVQAFMDLTAVGSQFLPGMGQGIADLARQFADWIRDMRNDGSLRRWMEEGWQAVVSLKDAFVELAGALGNVYALFTAGTGIDGFKDDMQGLHEFTALFVGDLNTLESHDSTKGPLGIGSQLEAAMSFSGVGIIKHLTQWVMSIDEVRGAFEHLPQVVTTICNQIIQVIDTLIIGINGALKGSLLGKMLSGVGIDISPIPLIDNLKMPGLGPTPGAPGSPGAPATPGSSTHPGGTKTQSDAPWTDPKTGQRKVMVPGLGWVDEMDPRIGGNLGSGGNWVPKDVPQPAPKNADGTKMSDSDKLKAAMAGIDPSQYKVDPFAPVPGLPVAGSLGKVTGTTGVPLPGGGNGYASIDQQAILEAQHAVESQAHDLEESRQKRLAMEKMGTFTQKEIDDAKWKEQEDAWALQKSQADLVDKQRGTTQKLKDGARDFGAALDADFGLSKGLPGLAENITKFVGNLMIAPLMAKSQQAQDASPYKGGFGLLGMMGAQNLSNGLSPLLGRPLPMAADGTTVQGGAGLTFSNSLLGANGQLGSQGVGGYMSDQMLIQRAGAGPGGHYEDPSSKATWDLSKNLGDCTSTIEDLVATMDGTPTGGRSMSTHNADSWLAEHGFVPGMGGPGDFRVGYNDHHMQATLPGGTNWNWGSDQAAQAGGTAPNSGAAYGNQHWYRPGTGIGVPAVPVVPGSPSVGQPVPATPGTMPTSQNPGLTPGYATGGAARGGANVAGPTGVAPWMRTGLAASDTIPAMLTPGEHVLDKADVAALGGQNAVYDFRRRLHGYAVGGAAEEDQQTDHGWNASGSPGPGNDGAGTRIGGSAPAYVAGGGGGLGMTEGGTLDTALNLAATAFPGIGQAAATGAKLASRAVEYAGQVAAIGAQGLMETFLPAGGSDLANNSWLTRIAGGLASASPAIPNIAGGAIGQAQQQGQNPTIGGPVNSPGPLTPDRVTNAGNALMQRMSNPDGQRPIAITSNNYGATEDRQGADIAYHISKTAAAGMPNGARAGNGKPV